MPKGRCVFRVWRSRDGMGRVAELLGEEPGRQGVICFGFMPFIRPESRRKHGDLPIVQNWLPPCSGTRRVRCDPSGGARDDDANYALGVRAV